MLNVSEIDILQNTADWHDDWMSLWRQTRQASFTQSLAWLVHANRQQPDEQLRVLMVSNGGHPAGFMPFHLRTIPTAAGGVRLLSVPRRTVGTAITPIGPHPTLTLMAAMRHLNHTLRDWDILELAGIDHCGIDGGRTRNALRLAGLHHRPQIDRPSRVIDFSGTWARYWTERGRRHRSHIQHAEQRLRAWGTFHWTRMRGDGSTVSNSDPGWDRFDDLQHVVRSDPAADGAALLPIVKEAHATARDCGAVDLNLLYAGGEAVAAVYNYIIDGQLECVLQAASPEYPRALDVLRRRMVQDSFLRGDRRMQLLADDLTAAFWANEQRATMRFVHVPPLAWRARCHLWGARWRQAAAHWPFALQKLV